MSGEGSSEERPHDAIGGEVEEEEEAADEVVEDCEER